MPSEAIQIAQTGRDLQITSPLGADKLILTGINGEEPMSRLFRYELEVFSDILDLQAADILGKNVTFKIARRDIKGEWRPFNGIVSRFASGSLVIRGYRQYRLEVVPALWLLTMQANSRIFQNKNALDIIKQVLQERAPDVSFETAQVRTTPTTREYCVQYRETDFDFISRLMEEEGIFYFFKHEDGSHKLIIADSPTAYYDAPENSVEYQPTGDFHTAIREWSTSYVPATGKWTQRDYNFMTPQDTLETSVATKIKVPAFSQYERFDYPGLYGKKAAGTPLTTRRMEHEEAEFQIASGVSSCRTFQTGAKFTLATHDLDSEANKSYVITSVRHSATDMSEFAGGAHQTYGNTFTCVPDRVPYRPPRVTEKPTVKGPQTAVVVGPAGEEVYTDKYGRIKVQFFWDREGKKDDQTSCFMRVSQVWAHKQWGGIYIPRIGMEVIVEFLEGDPDRPLVVGAVYNEDNKPPYALPDNKFHSGVKTRSEKGGDADFNELRFEDNSGKELVYFHGQKDFKRVVEHDDDLKVGNNQTIKIHVDRTEEVETGNETVKVSKGNRTVEISTGNEKLTVATGNRTTDISKGNESLTIGMGNRTTEIKMGNDSTKLSLGASATEAMQSIELKVGQSSVKIDQMGVTIKGMMIKIEGQLMTSVKGLMTDVKGDAMLTLKGGITMIG